MRYLFSILLIFCVVTVSAQDLRKFHFEEVHMGTLFQLTVYHSSDSLANLASQHAFKRVAELDSICSDYRLDSELNYVSEYAPKEPIVISQDLNFLLKESKKLYQQSEGLFSIASGPLTKLWRRSIRRKELPDSAIIENLLTHSQTSDVKLDVDSNTVQLLKEDMRLDLGGIAKGYAVDEAFKVLHTFGIEQAIVDGGGDIYAGKSPTGDKWKVVVGKRIVELDNYTAIATSGSTFKFLKIDDVSYSHIIDPRTGWGISNPNEVSVIADKCYIADALATVLSIDNKIDLSHLHTYGMVTHQTENN